MEYGMYQVFMPYLQDKLLPSRNMIKRVTAKFAAPAIIGFHLDTSRITT